MVTNSMTFQEIAAPTLYQKQDFADLLGITADALKITPPMYVSSLLGLPWTWIPPHPRFSEFSIIDVWRLGRTINYLVNVTLPSIPRTPPTFGPPILDDLFWEPTVILQRPDQNGSYTTFLDEAWFFINGIMTNDSVAQLNAAFISYLFHRPLTIIQNSTNSFAIDLLQCAIGKEWDRTVEPAIKAFVPIYDVLKSDKKKVVVIAHSQGTIIIARVLELLNLITRPVLPVVKPAVEAPGLPVAEKALLPEGERLPAPPEFIYPDDAPIDLSDFSPLEESELAKLEIYCFANCANRMKYFKPPQDGELPVPLIENFGNENDIVSRLGMLAPNPVKWGIDLDGPFYMREGAWGHLLNVHYLFPIRDHQKSGYRKGGIGGTRSEEHTSELQSPL
jgi:hypothetical protein